jgi:hypothetical protein
LLASERLSPSACERVPGVFRLIDVGVYPGTWVMHLGHGRILLPEHGLTLTVDPQHVERPSV